EEDQPPDHGVEPALVAIVTHVALDETDVLEAGVGRPFLRDCEQTGLGVDADDLAGRPDDRRNQPGDMAEPGPEVEHAHARLDAGRRQEARGCRLVERRLRVEPGDLVTLATEHIAPRGVHRPNSGKAEPRRRAPEPPRPRGRRSSPVLTVPGTVKSLLFASSSASLLTVPGTVKTTDFAGNHPGAGRAELPPAP